MAEATGPVPAHHPLMIAWTAYQQTDDFANSKRWAMKSPKELGAHDQDDIVQGSLWAAFAAGFAARASQPEGEK